MAQFLPTQIQPFTTFSALVRPLRSLALLGALGCSSEAEPGLNSPNASTGGGDATSGGGVAAGGTGTPPNNTGGSLAHGGTGGLPAVGDPEFWDRTDIPASQEVLVFKFLNRTNGQFSDDEVFWSFKNDVADELHSIAEMPTYDMPANSSGRMYFYVCDKNDSACLADQRSSKYYDFIEHTIGENQYNGNTTRVDAFGLKLAMLLHASDGWEAQVGEDQATFLEAREDTFEAFLNFVPDEYAPCGQAPHAPYRIVEPGACGFNAEGPHSDYYNSFVDELWANNGLTVPKPTANGNGLGAYPDLSAAIYRHVGSAPGTFDSDGNLLNQALWDDPSTFYQAAPAHYYASFWHTRSIDGKSYGFPYDDVGAYSTYISHADPEYLLVAIGW